MRIDLERLPETGAARRSAVELHDAFVNTVLEILAPRRITLVYVSSPIDGLTAEEKKAAADKAQQAAARAALELRSVGLEARAEKGNETVVGGGLFHRYQFFTPAIFMGYMALFLMLGILYVGLSAVSSIQVSYGAFEKEMGPAAAKKAQ